MSDFFALFDFNGLVLKKGDFCINIISAFFMKIKGIWVF